MSTIDAENNVTETFYVIMQKSLVGGARQPRERYLITRAPRSANFMVDVKVRPSEDSLRLDPTINRLLKVAEHAKSIARLQQLMGEIPTQYTGVKDLYGLDTSVVHVSDPRRLLDLHLSGDQAPEVLDPTEEQKVKFDEVLRIIENWGRKGGPLPMY